jgi:3-hydroxybutyryl-CoA dehydratase
MDAAVLAWADIQEGMTVEWEFAVDEAQMRQFAELTGDYAPLHLDAEFARARGFAGPVVYGALLCGQLSRLIGMHIPGRDGFFIGLTADFRRPVIVGETVALRAEVVQASAATSAIKLKYTMRTNGKVAVSGTADGVLRSA